MVSCLQILGARYSASSCLQWPSAADKRPHVNRDSRIVKPASPLTAAAYASNIDGHAANRGRTYDVVGFRSYSNTQLTSTTSCSSTVYGDCGNGSVSRSTSVIEFSSLWRTHSGNHTQAATALSLNTILLTGCIRLFLYSPCNESPSSFVFFKSGLPMQCLKPRSDRARGHHHIWPTCK